MAEYKHKVAYIGPANVHPYLKEYDDSWDLQVPVPSVRAFDDMINSDDENPQISRDTKLIIIFSRLFYEDEKEFAEVVAYYAPYAVVTILIPNQDIAKDKARIENKIKQAQVNLSEEYDDYNANTPFYFVNYEDAYNGIYDAINQYTQNPAVERETIDAIKPMLASQELANTINDNNEEEEDLENNSIHINPAKEGANGQVVAITSSKGGSGKSTITMSLASYIARGSQVAYEAGKFNKPYKVIVIDLDVRDGQLGFLNGQSSPNIVDIVMSGAISQETIKEGIYHNPSTGVDYIFASKRPRNAKEIPASFYADLIQELRGMYDFILLDTSVNYLDPLLEQVAYPISDKIIFVTDMGISSIYGMRRWIQENIYTKEHQVINPDDEKVGIVINKAIKDVNMSPNKIQDSAKGLPILGVIPNAPQLITYSANIHELQKILNYPAINDAFKGLAEAVVDDRDALGQVSFN
jgi:MinD-like ATPase involved in chromosome partitioning or flagellar assembly